MHMRLMNNFLDMPILLKLVVMVSLAAPVIVIASVLTGSIVPMADHQSPYGNADNLTEVLLVVLSALPISLAAYMMLVKNRGSRFMFVGSWVLICFSPLFLFSVRSQLEVFWLETSFNFVLGGIISIYLFFGSNVRHYFNEVNH